MEHKRIIVVLGMHRSGTSAVTRSLELLGIGLGTELQPAAADNPTGFWEDTECVAINEALLAHLGSAYDRLLPRAVALPDDDTVRALRQRAVERIRHRVDETGLWGFKDPRTCRLLAFWRAAFAAAGVEPSYVLALRHPSSVAASMARRNSAPPEKTAWLWLQHLLPAFDETRGARRVVVDYDHFLDAPEVELRRMAEALALPQPSPAAIAELARGFLDPSLRHSRHPAAVAAGDGLVEQAWQLFEAAALGRLEVDGAAFADALHRLRDQFDAAAPATDYIDRLEGERQSLWERIAALEGERQMLWEHLTALNQRFDAMHAAEQVRDRDIAMLRATLDERQAQLQRIYASHSWRLTGLLRGLRRTLLTRPRVWLQAHGPDALRTGWQRMPLGQGLKRAVKRAVFGGLSPLLAGTEAYRRWHAFEHGGGFASVGAGGCDAVDIAASRYVPRVDVALPAQLPARLICFYLPQFHAIAENDAWWGKGFTEWTNVQPARPQFVGHAQPHVPEALGYYNLLDPAVQERQVELAKAYGISGFCFYFYWFGGKRLLEAPLQAYLSRPELDLPFCLCWANENWSRRWDGLDSEVLIAQQHSPDDDLAFIAHIAQYLRDPRYIRVEGKPLLLVYRPAELPSARETADRWRGWCRANGVGEIHLAYTQSFEAVDPRQYGFDAAVEFPPNNSAPPVINDQVVPLDDTFAGTVYDWRVFVERSQRYVQGDYPLYRSVCPSWDNTARRKQRGAVFLHSEPRAYQRWLENALAQTAREQAATDRRLVFVNAWNEWAEGAHLEPDTRDGYAWLQATRNALCGSDDWPDDHRRMMLVSHDAHPHGAQYLALNLAHLLNDGMGFAVDLVCLGDGPLKPRFAQWATLHDLAGLDPLGEEARALAARLHRSGHRHALVNTTVSGLFLQTLAEQGVRCVSLVHELGGVIEQSGLQGHARAIADHAHRIVFPAAEVAEVFGGVAPMAPGQAVVRPQGLYKRMDRTKGRAALRGRLRHGLGLPQDALIVLGMGYADRRKGIDLFVDAGLALAPREPRARWVWVGHWDADLQREVEQRLAQHPQLRERFVFPGIQHDTDLYYGGADLFALTSREDPFPSVVLEAMDAGLPVVGFHGAGGCSTLIAEGCGRLVERVDAAAFADAVAALLAAPEARAEMGRRGRELIAERFAFRRYVGDLLDLLGVTLPRVSVVVPNFNYAHYLPERLGSIVAQRFPIHEIIFLDDASTDDSVAVAERILADSGIDHRIVVNETNAGSVFRQWRKGVELASGSHVWIAEADDSCDNGLLEELCRGLRTPGVVLSYCESQQIDGDGKLLGRDYLSYVEDIDPRHWLTPFVADGPREIVDTLSVKNTIPNVSAVLFDAAVLRDVLTREDERISSLRVAGDWMVYVLVLAVGRVAFSPRALNRHRRHATGVTLRNLDHRQIDEIRLMQDYVAKLYPVPPALAEAARRYLGSLHVEHRLVPRSPS